MVVVVACTLILLAAIVVATVLIIRSRKSLTTQGNGNVDVGQPVYENQSFNEGHGTAVNDISRSYENTEISTEVSVSKIFGILISSQCYCFVGEDIRKSLFGVW